MKRFFTKLKFLILLALFPGSMAFGQQLLNLERALDIASQNSPDIRRSLLNLERSQESLNAQKAALKSQFSLSLNPIEYSRTRSFDDYYSSWYTNESLGTSGTFTVAQPILVTDGTLSLVNRFGWQKSTSDINKPQLCHAATQPGAAGDPIFLQCLHGTNEPDHCRR